MLVDSIQSAIDILVQAQKATEPEEQMLLLESAREEVETIIHKLKLVDLNDGHSVGHA